MPPAPRSLYLNAWLVVALCTCATSTSPATRVSEVPHPAAAAQSHATAQVHQWPQASLRFHTNGAWVGADSAYSIPLDETKVLWLFADTFIDPAADGSRDNGPNQFIRNSVAIQSGPDATAALDLSRSELRFYWAHDQSGTAASYFRDVDRSDEWVWPLHGTRLPGGALVLFRMRVVKEDGGFGFREDGWDAVAIDDPNQPPDRWQPRVLTPKLRSFNKLVGASVLMDSNFLYAYAVDYQTPDRPVSLVRWPLTQLSSLTEQALDDPEWWTESGFVRQSSMTSATTPAALFSHGQIELSVHYDAAQQRFVEVQMQGLFLSDPNTQLGIRTAPRPEGPWSAFAPLFQPPESALPDATELIAYAAKAHPEQHGDGLVLTYMVNHLKRFPPPDRVYYPQVLRLRWAP